MIVFVFSVFPELVETSASNNEGWVNFDSVWSELWILKELSEALKISLNSHIGQIRHHMCDYFISTVFCHGKGFFHCFNSVSSIRIPCNIFIDALYSYLQSSASIGKEI